MKIVVGLGNPGITYSATRHNVGFALIKYLARTEKIKLREKAFHCLLGRGTIGQVQVILALPLTFMNLSGQALAALAKRYNIALTDVLVVCDDAALPLGAMRIRPSGSDGGHKGLRSIIEELGSSDFARLRIGIGQPPTDAHQKPLTEFVLGKFSKKETPVIEKTIKDAAEAILLWIKEGAAPVMNRFNRKGV
ncbi:MAG: aminoacyl-tRNA hydrolase [Candidatus Omnitrophota bacterium]